MILVVVIQGMFGYDGVRADRGITGTIMDEDGAPVGGAMVFLWREKAFVAMVESRPSGYFEFDIENVEGHTIYVLADAENTPGVDYLPFVRHFGNSSIEELSITLDPAASLVFEGDLQYVMSERAPITIDYTVLTQIPTDKRDRGGNDLVYGNSDKSLSGFLELEPSHLIVPANAAFNVDVNFSILTGPQIEYASFLANVSENLPLGVGERVTVDISRYSMPFNLGVVDSRLSEVESLMEEMEGYGFYLVSERKSVESSKNFIQSATDLMLKQIYEESFSAAKRAFIDIEQTHSHLISIFEETNASVSMIIVLLAFTSTIIGFLSSNKEWMKMVASVASYLVVLAVLYLTYPGSVIISVENFLRTAALALASILILSRILPRFFKKRSRSYVPVRNIIIPIFSIAKRSIVRRKTRFGLTFTAMTILVMSFVVLTSFYQGYGLITVNLSGQESPVRGVLLRAPGYTQRDPVFLGEEFEVDWLRSQDESASITLKAENIPFAFPVASLNRQPIRGVVGVDTQAEAAIVDLNGLLIEGELPSRGVAISEALRKKLGVDLGDSLLFEGEPVPLEGVLSDAAMLGLKDIDGSTYLPGKEVNINPEGEPRLYETRPCEPDEVVVTHISRAIEISMVKMSRVVVGVRDDVDVNEFAVRLTLERGFPTWATSEEGVFHARLGTYIESKGRSLVVLFVIVVLNIVMTMLNSLYERKGEIYVLSTVGLNPAHITSIFFVEAGIIGLTAGGLGYLAGMAFYKVLLLVGVTLDVRQKVSAFWSIASLVIAVASILIGTLFSIRYSVIITPSLLKRWRISEGRRGVTDPWEIAIPIKILSEEGRAFTDYVESALRALENNPVSMTSSIGVTEDADGKTTIINFVYKSTKSTVGNLYTRNKLLVEGDAENEVFKVTLVSFGDQRNAYQTGSLIRRIVMRWSADKGSQEFLG